MKHLIRLVALLLVISSSALAQDKPVYTIKGNLKPGGIIRKAVLKCRERRVEKPFKVDPDTGRFSVEVEEPAAYDIALDTNRGHIEGVNLKVTMTDLGLPREPGRPLDKDDKQFFIDYLAQMKTFENKKRVLLIEGDRGQGKTDGWARVLVELIRDQKHTYKPGTMTYRVEVWDFVFKYGTWRKAFERAQGVQFRELLPIKAFPDRVILFEPKLGGFFPTRNNPVITVNYTVPKDLSDLKGHHKGQKHQ